jgi:predicted GIY-YIG superfamily endonuclease
MVHWVYILECDDKIIYVGETIHLYKRLGQHIGGKGGKNTHAHIPKRLIGLYKVNDNQSFDQYRSDIKHNVDIKNTI